MGPLGSLVRVTPGRAIGTGRFGPVTVSPTPKIKIRGYGVSAR
ncbi:hypothetical protein BJ964_000341 [Actinoplanes lobatus]|uniref:Uncharacterized protein n=1 Tax=Actinoplanes lobatus TaxID=113568 RepID=A0A7W7H8X2_9ACTN|nr:hypothetical protein [Actinoplanes lobatus]